MSTPQALAPTDDASAARPARAIPEPKFMLQLGSMVMLKDEEYQIERRLPDGRWQLLSTREGTPLLQTDRQLAERLQRGEFYVASERGLKIFAPAPLSPIAIGEKAHARNVRKFEYVQACLNAPAGFRWSRRRLLPAIKACAAARGEEPPSFSSVYNWLIEHERYGLAYGTAAFSDRHDLKGNMGGRMLAHQERAIEFGIERWLELGKKTLAYDLVCEHVRKFDAEKGHLLDKFALGSAYVDSNGALVPPSRRTFERRCALVDRMVRDWALTGRRRSPRVPLTGRGFSLRVLTLVDGGRGAMVADDLGVREIPTRQSVGLR